MPKNHSYLAILAALFLLPTLAWGEDGGTPSAAEVGVSITQAVDAKETLKVGESIRLSATIKHPLDTKVALTDDLELGRWELVTSETGESATDESGATTRMDFVFAVFRAGETTLPPIGLEVSDANETIATIQTAPVTLKFISDLPTDSLAEFTGPADSVEIIVKDYSWGYVAGTAAGIGLLGLLGFLAFRKRRDAVVFVEIPRIPHEVALEKLGALAGENLIERGEFMVFYVRLSETTREYLGAINGFPGTELTTREIGFRLEGHVWPRGLDTAHVLDFLKHCDIVKFSGQTPTSAQAEDALRQAFTIVELTRPRAELAEPPEDLATGEEVPETLSASAPEATQRWAPNSVEEEE